VTTTPARREAAPVSSFPNVGGSPWSGLVHSLSTFRADGCTELARFGGAEGDRTPDLRIANATLSQLSYGPDHDIRTLAGSGGTMVGASPTVKAGSGKPRALNTGCPLADPGSRR
jgi:hypothetical protein